MVYLTCAFIGLGGRDVIKTGTEVAASVCLHMLDVRSHLSGSSIIQLSVACENICFSSLFAAGNVSRGGRRRHEKLDKFIFGTA